MEIGLSDLAMNTAVLERGVAADEMGFAHLYLADAGSYSYDQWVVLGALARMTERIRLGLITNPYTRRPETTANALRTVYDLTGGRAFICLSRGGELVLRGMGARHERPLAVMRESIALVREQAPEAELWVATKGPKMLALALELADGVLLSGMPLAYLPQVVRELRAAAPKPTKLGFTCTHIRDDESLLSGRIRLATEMLAMREDVREAAGIGPVLVEQVRAGLLGGLTRDQAAELVPEEIARRFALTGEVEELPEQLDRLEAETGLDVLDVSAQSALDGAQALARWRSVARV